MGYGNPQEAYLALAQALVDQVESEWDKIVCHLEVYKGSAEDVAKVFTGEEYEQIFIPASRFFLEFNNATSGKEPWYTCDFVLYPDGRFTTDFGYEKTEWMKLIDEICTKVP